MKRRKHDEILPLGEDQDYDGLSDAVIRWAKFRYGKMIAEYQSLPWLKKLFRRNPKFCLVRTHDDLFCSSPGIWYMRVPIRFMGMMSFCVHGYMICILIKSFLMLGLS